MKEFITEPLLAGDHAVQEICNGQHSRICRCGTQAEAIRIAHALQELDQFRCGADLLEEYLLTTGAVLSFSEDVNEWALFSHLGEPVVTGSDMRSVLTALAESKAVG